MLKPLTSAVFTLVLAAPGAHAHAGELKLSLQNGMVTLVAQSVPVRQILAEWARIGQAKVVNGDKVTGPPITLELIDVPEAYALDILLRSAAGYMVAPRAVLVAGASRFDRILIMPASGVATAAAGPGRLPQAPPALFPPGIAGPRVGVSQPPVIVDDDEDEEDEPEEEDDDMEADDSEDAEADALTAPSALRPGMMPPRAPDNMQDGVPAQAEVPQASPRPGVVATPPPQPAFRNPYGVSTNPNLPRLGNQPPTSPQRPPPLD